MVKQLSMRYIVRGASFALSALAIPPGIASVILNTCMPTALSLSRSSRRILSPLLTPLLMASRVNVWLFTKLRAVSSICCHSYLRECTLSGLRSSQCTLADRVDRCSLHSRTPRPLCWALRDAGKGNRILRVSGEYRGHGGLPQTLTSAGCRRGLRARWPP